MPILKCEGSNFSLVCTEVLIKSAVKLAPHLTAKVPCLMPLKTLAGPKKWSVAGTELSMVSSALQEQFALYKTQKVALSRWHCHRPCPWRHVQTPKIRASSLTSVKSIQTLEYPNSDWNWFRITLLGNKACGWALQNIWPQADCGKERTKHTLPARTCQGRKIDWKKLIPVKKLDQRPEKEPGQA